MKHTGGNDPLIEVHKSKRPVRAVQPLANTKKVKVSRAIHLSLPFLGSSPFK